MKKLFLILSFAITALAIQAQKLEKIQDNLKANKLEQAKTDIETFLANEKNKSNSEGWYTKGKIYVAIAGDEKLKAANPEAREIAFEALKKYIQLEKNVKDSTARNVKLILDGNAPFVELYRSHSGDGATFYNANNFNDAFTSFRKCLDVFEFIAESKIIPLQFDTTTVLYAGISAEKANRADDAAIYYQKIADRKINSEGFTEIYKWLADHYGKKGDIANASKYVGLGKEVFPKDQWWDAFELDLIKEKGSKEELYKAYEKVIASNPGNHIFPFNYAVELYEAGYVEDIAKRPSNSKELIAKAIDYAQKSISIKSDYANAQMLIGQITYNQGFDISTENKAIRPPAGGKLKPEELKKKEELRKQVAAKFAEALPYFEKVDAILGPQGKLKMDDKTILKQAYDLIITIYENSQNTDKVNEYTEKFNTVDKKHS